MIDEIEVRRVDVFTITLETGEVVVWNITKLNKASRAGAFGVVRYAPTSDLPPADWSSWGPADRAKVDGIKKNPRALGEPSIAIGTSNRNFLLLCFADGQHRVTARQELGMLEIPFYLVPAEVERDYRVENLADVFGDAP